MAIVTNADRQLAAAAKKKAGGPGKLAELLGLGKSAVSGWGRIRPIPRNTRKTLENYVVTGQISVSVDQAVDVPKTAAISPSPEPPWKEFADLLHELVVALPRHLESIRSEIRMIRAGPPGSGRGTSAEAQ
jgi:hypothetical protein